MHIWILVAYCVASCGVGPSRYQKAYTEDDLRVCSLEDRAKFAIKDAQKEDEVWHYKVYEGYVYEVRVGSTSTGDVYYYVPK